MASVSRKALALSADKRRLYAEHGDATQVSAFAADPKYGKLLERFIARLPERVSKLARFTR